jgi:mannose-6-phosphate isomerase-like protein (cupin superfamily)
MQQPRTAVIRAADAARTVATLTDYRFANVFHHGSLDAGVYAPVGEDTQQPHTRDEVYVVLTGRARFVGPTGSDDVGPGDLVFVAANAVHRFEAMSEDFSTWVLFYGPEGGEDDARPRR